MGGLRDLGLAVGLAAGLAGCASGLEERINSYATNISEGIEEVKTAAINRASMYSASFYVHNVIRSNGFYQNYSRAFSGICIGNDNEGNVSFLVSAHSFLDHDKYLMARGANGGNAKIEYEVFLAKYTNKDGNIRDTKIPTTLMYSTNDPQKLDLAFITVYNREVSDNIEKCTDFAKEKDLILGRKVYLLGNFVNSKAISEANSRGELSLETEAPLPEQIIKYLHPSSLKIGNISVAPDGNGDFYAIMGGNKGNSGSGVFIFDGEKMRLAGVYSGRIKYPEGESSYDFITGIAGINRFINESLEALKNNDEETKPKISIDNIQSASSKQ